MMCRYIMENSSMYAGPEDEGGGPVLPVRT